MNYSKTKFDIYVINSPEVFEVAAKRNSAIWRNEQYKDPQFRQLL